MGKGCNEYDCLSQIHFSLYGEDINVKIPTLSYLLLLTLFIQDHQL